MTPASESFVAFTMTMNRIVVLLVQVGGGDLPAFMLATNGGVADRHGGEFF
jgi:hypothetical protein